MIKNKIPEEVRKQIVEFLRVRPNLPHVIAKEQLENLGINISTNTVFKLLMKLNPHHTKKGPGRIHRDGREYREQQNRRRLSESATGWFDGMAGRFRSGLGLGR